MTFTPSALAQIDDLNSRLAAESIFAQAGSDEGLVPTYSLLTEIMGLTAEGDELYTELHSLHDLLDALLDAATPFDEVTVKSLHRLVAWMPAALEQLRKGESPDPMPVPVDATPEVEGEGKSTTEIEAPAEDVFPETVEELLDLNLEENRELLTEFHSEALDHLSQIESALLVLDGAPTDRDSLNGLFRSFHTLKGVAGFLRLGPMNRLSHEVESLLDLARNDELLLTPTIITEILRSRDALGEMVEQITHALEKNRLPEKIVPVGELITNVRALAKGDAKPASQEVTPCEITAMPTNSESVSPVTSSGASPTKSVASSTVRVNTEKLDSLVDVVGELVIVQSQLQESARGLGSDGSPLSRNLAQLSRITKDLQFTAMSLRMVPIKPTFQRMERLVRDLSREFGKKVGFETLGEETEIDRTVVEEIVDPLVHMVRNSLDHGLENPAQRLEAGKSEQGLMRLAAYHEGSNLVIELVDDGRGINTQRVLAKARERGLVAEDETLDQAAIVDLIFHPGFSTAEKVTDVSGRGVGMDVVKRNIEKLRGRIEVTTEDGQGTTFRVRLPLTTAIIDGLLVKVGEDRFILPAIMVQVALRPEKSALSTVQGSGEVLRHRDSLLPLHRLHRRFSISEAVQDPTEGIVVIIECGGRTYALLVDDLLNKQEVVVKNLGAFMQNMPGVAGGAILGDGTIALILDPASLTAAA